MGASSDNVLDDACADIVPGVIMSVVPWRVAAGFILSLDKQISQVHTKTVDISGRAQRLMFDDGSACSRCICAVHAIVSNQIFTKCL